MLYKSLITHIIKIIRQRKKQKETATGRHQDGPPPGWIQDGWDTHDSQEVKGQYALILVLKGAINELIANTEMPESQKEQLSKISKGAMLHKHADEHLENIAEMLEPLVGVGAGYTFFIRTVKKAAANQGMGGSQTVKLSRARQVTSKDGRKMSSCGNATRGQRP